MSQPNATSQLARDLWHRFERGVLRRSTTPWMLAKELDIVHEVLRRLAPRRCLEWGGGLSTLRFPSHAPTLERWLTIEHHRAWHASVARRNRDARVEVRFVPPDRGTYDVIGPDGSAEDFHSYIVEPERTDDAFDFILIDGRARAHCLHAARRLLAARGIVVLHDANRSAYFEEAPEFTYAERFVDWRRRGGGIWLGSVDLPIADVLDIAPHRVAWATHARLAGFLGNAPMT